MGICRFSFSDANKIRHRNWLRVFKANVFFKSYIYLGRGSEGGGGNTKYTRCKPPLLVMLSGPVICFIDLKLELLT